MGRFEEQYLDVLQNIEFAIITTYRQNRSLTDYDVDTVLSALLHAYRSEQQNEAFRPPAMKPPVQEMYEAVKQACDWRLGRVGLAAETPQQAQPSPKPITVDEIMACLRRIRKSVNFWNRERAGTQGYLQFIDQFMP